MTLEVVPVHKYPEYLEDCCKVINQEWKRSETARLHSLQQSCDQLPTSLVLLKNKSVIGHVKLSIIPGIRTACFVESLVIEKILRGKGYGSILMKEAEHFCKGLGLNTVYLSTKGQEKFYSKLGYIQCAPVSIYGSFVPLNINSDSLNNNIHAAKTVILESSSNETKDLHISPPPPPPIPLIMEVKKIEKVFMKKSI